MTDVNPYQSPNDVSEALPLVAASEDDYGPFLGPAAICLIGSLLTMFCAGILLLGSVVNIVIDVAHAWETLGVTLAIFLTACLIHFAGHAMLNRRHRVVVVVASVLGLLTCVFAPLFAVILYRLSKPDVWYSFR